jgi:hypothetical protein
MYNIIYLLKIASLKEIIIKLVNPICCANNNCSVATTIEIVGFVKEEVSSLGR